MRAKITYFVTAAVLVFYFVLVGSRGVLLIRHGTLLTVAFGVAVLILPVIGVWFLWKNTQFVSRANALAAELDAEGGLPVDELVRTPSGRIDRDSADAVFARRREETEDAPDDWRCWFRLAVAYQDARDTPRARKAMQRAIALHMKEARPGTPERACRAGPAIGPRASGLSVLVPPRLHRVGRPVERLAPRQEVGVAVGEQWPERLATLAYDDQRLSLDRAREPEPLHRLLHGTDGGDPVPRHGHRGEEADPAHAVPADPGADSQESQCAADDHEGQHHAHRRARQCPGERDDHSREQDEGREQQQEGRGRDPPGSRTVRTTPTVVVVERKRDVLGARVKRAVGRQKGQGHD